MKCIFLSLQEQSVEIIAQQMVTDLPSSYTGSLRAVGGYEMAKKAASYCYQKTGLSPYDVDVIELHDCFACNEVSQSGCQGS